MHYITVHHKRIDLDEGRCETLHYITRHHKRIDHDEGRCVTLHYRTIHHKIDLHECCMGLVGEEAGALVAAGDERYLVCAAGAAGVVSDADVFLLCVLQRVVVTVCVVLCVL